MLVLNSKHFAEEMGLTLSKAALLTREISP